ncbi:MAG: hypothetical protein ABIR79_21910 [Candidatus Binatia bacterium]
MRNPGNAPATDKRGRPYWLQTCRNDDPGCDFDLGAGVCEFRVAVCLNNVDPLLPECAAAGVPNAIRVVQPRLRTDPDNYTRLLAAFDELRDAATGATDLALPVAPTDRNLCSTPFAIRVPLKDGKKGRVILRTQGESVITDPKVTKDKDQVMLVCTP